MISARTCEWSNRDARGIGLTCMIRGKPGIPNKLTELLPLVGGTERGPAMAALKPDARARRYLTENARSSSVPVNTEQSCSPLLLRSRDSDDSGKLAEGGADGFHADP
jgi:hypothetical protein